MEVNIAYILSAGIGSRMGPIGKIVPKPLWPVFDQTLLSLQISYIRSLGIENIYINIHHQAKEMSAYLKKHHPQVKILHEEELLGIGGAIHNLARQKEVSYQGNVLIVNSDQFLLLSKEKIARSLMMLKKIPALLFIKKVANNDLYGAIRVEDDVLVGLVPNKELPRDKFSLTYTGNSLINLNELAPHEGISHFFDTVATYKSDSVKVLEIDDNDYWDFGTLKRYHDSLFEIIKTDSSDNFVQFLVRSGALCLEDIKRETLSYQSRENGHLNFSKSQFSIFHEPARIDFKNYSELLEN